MRKIVKIFEKKYSILSRQNVKRHFFKDLFEFEEFLLEKFLIVENECRILAQEMWIKIFELIKNDARYASPKEYFIKNNVWPKLDANILERKYYLFSSVFYQLLLFFIDNKIINYEEIVTFYPNYSTENIISDLKKFILVIFDRKFIQLDPKTQKQIFFGIFYISELLFTCSFSQNNVNKYFECFNENGKNYLQILLEIVTYLSFENSLCNIKLEGNFRKCGNILNIFENLIYMNVNRQDDFLTNCSRIENFLIENVIFFRNLDFADNLEILLNSNISENSLKIFSQIVNKILDLNENCLKSLPFVLKKNFEIVINSSYPKLRLLIKDYFTLLYKIDFNFISNLIFENYFNFDILANLFLEKILNEKDGNNHLEVFTLRCCTEEDKLFIIFILLEKALKSQKSKLFSITSKILTKLTIFKSNDAIISQIKIISMILFHYYEIKHFSKEELDSIFKLIDKYITEKQIIIIKELLNLLGVLIKYIITINEGGSNLKDYFEKKQENIRYYFISIQGRYFPIKTSYLKVNTKDYYDFELLFNTFLNSFNMVKTFEFLELLFPVLREDKTIYSIKIKATLKGYVDEVLKSKDQDYILTEIRKVIDLYLNVDIDKNLKDNIRFTIMKILGFKFISKCEIQTLKRILLLYYKRFEEIIKQNIQDIKLSFEKKFTIILEK